MCTPMEALNQTSDYTQLQTIVEVSSKTRVSSQETLHFYLFIFLMRILQHQLTKRQSVRPSQEQVAERITESDRIPDGFWIGRKSPRALHAVFQYQ